MTGFEKAIVISLAVLGVMSTRFLPFLIFRPNRPTPPLVRYLGKWLGPAVFGLLVVYCFRQTIATGDRLIPSPCSPRHLRRSSVNFVGTV